LKEPLNKGNNGARKEAIRQVWKHASSDALREDCISILSSVLKYNGDWKDRREAATLLGRMTCPSAEEALKQASNDVRPLVREQVALSLSNIIISRSKRLEKELDKLPPAKDH
jgi:hypothetical protein